MNKLAMVLLWAAGVGLVLMGCGAETEQDGAFDIQEHCGDVGKGDEAKSLLCDVPEEGKEDSLTGARGLPVSIDDANTAVWEVRNAWGDTDTAAAREAGIAWEADSGLTWEEKYERWVQSMRKVDGHDTYYETFELSTPWGKTIQAPSLECAEVAIFLRVTFAAWYGLPFFLEAADRHGNRLYFGHFGARTADGRYGRTPEFKSWYADHTRSYDGGSWPVDEKLRGREIPGNASDLQRFLGDEVHAGAYFDEIFLNKRVGYFLCLTLAYFGSINLASAANTYHLEPESIHAGDLLIERWQRSGIGHVMVIKSVESLAGGNLDAQVVSGSMPRRQPKWEDAATSKRYFTMDECGGPGSNYDGESYYKLGGGVRRFRAAQAVGGRWTNVVLDIHRNDWISDRDYDAIKARPERFEDLLGEISPEQKREVLLAAIEDSRMHLRSYPASCAARIRREEAFAELVALCEEEFAMSPAETDRRYRKLEDYVFAELVYEESKTCCWNASTAAMYEIIMQYNEQHVAAGGGCQEPVVFMARDAGGGSDGYDLFRQYAQDIGRGAEWVDWSAGEACPQSGVSTDSEAAHDWLSWCEIAAGPAGNCPDAYDGNDSRATAALLGAGSYAELAVCDDIPDWFEIDATDGARLTVSIAFADADGDLDLEAYDADGTQLAQSNSSSDDETINLTKQGRVWIKVYGYQGDANGYRLDIAVDGGGDPDPDDPCPDAFAGNDSRATAAEVGAGSWSGLRICAGLSDWFRLPADADTAATVTIAFNHAAGDLDLRAVDADGQQLAISQSTANHESLQLDLAADRYLEVYGYNGASGEYELTIDID